MSDMTMELFYCISNAIREFSIKHPEFFTEQGFSAVAANSLCMLTACYIENTLSNQDIKNKLKMLEDILDMNKRYLYLFDKQNKNNFR